MRLTWLAALVLGACVTDPDHADPLDSEFSSARDDTDVPTVPNNCDTRTHTFAASATGYVEGQLEGVAGYEYRSGDDITSVYLNSCPDNSQDQVVALHRFGRDRPEVGPYDVEMFPEDPDSFGFSFVNNRDGVEVVCNDRATGSVVIEEIDFYHIKGTFEVSVRCTSEDLTWRIPRDATFSGSFDAVNFGRE